MAANSPVGHFSGRRAALAVTVIVFLACGSIAAHAQNALRGVALVIGNGDYEHLPALQNPPNDARAVEELLDELGFETDMSSDRDARRLARDLRDFVEDAEGADVAIVYYAGHGIEAGGENFLVPVDADIGALDEAGEKLVPVSTFLEDLQRTVPVTIILLDACRDNPFPAGSLVRLEAGGEAAPMGQGGLGETRGARALTAPQPGVESFGAVVGFAAEPGKVALDGAPGENSPYAAAVLRHLDTMAGAEFGLVMRMVAEEVYLKTGGAQRPWVNESLRRLLYFGSSPEPVAGETGEILAERRQLLLSIAELPTAERRQVESVARDGGVPLDGVFAMLAALGENAPDDPAALDRMLREQAERLKEMRDERAALRSTDAEIVRLSSLAEEALGEGAIRTAIALGERAKARVAELSRTIDDAEAQLRARRLEFAAVYARSAETYELAFDFARAAADYRAAFEEVERWDDEAAWLYKTSEARALGSLGVHTADAGELRNAVNAAREAVRIIRREDDVDRWSKAMAELAANLSSLADTGADAEAGREAIALFEQLLADLSPASNPQRWAVAVNNLALALHGKGEREAGAAALEQAAALYRDLVDAGIDLREVGGIGKVYNNFGTTLSELGARTADGKLLGEAVEIYGKALAANDRATQPVGWAMAQVNLGVARNRLAGLTGDMDGLRSGVEALQAALGEITREVSPGYWAKIQNNLSAMLREVGEPTGDTSLLRQALEASDRALSVVTREAAPLEWADFQINRGGVLNRLGYFGSDAAMLGEAAKATASALEVYTAGDYPLDRAKVMMNLGAIHVAMADLEEGTANVAQAIEHYRAAAAFFTREAFPQEYGAVTGGLGRSLALMGERTGDAALSREALDLLGQALEVTPRDRHPTDWARLQYRTGETLLGMARASDDATLAGQAVERFDEALAVFTEQANPQMFRRLNMARGEAMAIAGGGELGVDDNVRILQTLEAAMPPALVPGQEALWVQVNATMANGYFVIARSSQKLDHFDKAMTYQKRALETLATMEDRAPQAAAMIELADMLRGRGVAGKDPADYIAAAETYQKAGVLLDVPGADPAMMIRSGLGLGSTAMSIGQWNGEVAWLETAAQAYRYALSHMAADDGERLDAMNNLATVALTVAQKTGTSAGAVEARDVWQALAALLDQRGIEGFDDYVAGKIAEAESEIARMR